MWVLRALASKTLVQRQQLYCMILYVYPSTSLLLTSTHTNRQPANDSTRWQKNIALVMMGLESGSVGTLAVSVFEDDGMSGSHSQCFSEPNSHVQQQPGFSWSFIFFCIMLVGGLVFFMFKVYKMARDAYQSFEQIFTDIAMLEPLVDRLCNDGSDFQAQLQRVRAAHAELQGELEMLSDTLEGIHWGLVNMGGYTRYHSMDPQHRQQMFTTERANLVAARTMSSQRYLETIRSQHRGVVSGADNTDVAETSDSDSAAVNPDDDRNLGTAAQIIRDEVNSALQRGAWHEAASFQHALMYMLDITNQCRGRSSTLSS